VQAIKRYGGFAVKHHSFFTTVLDRDGQLKGSVALSLGNKPAVLVQKYRFDGAYRLSRLCGETKDPAGNQKAIPPSSGQKSSHCTLDAFRLTTINILNVAITLNTLRLTYPHGQK
jgi:hypothetical protein